MQLTNIARDVVEDGKRNRIYINSDFESIKKTINLSKKFYDSSFKSINEIPMSCRFAIIVARRLYKKIGNKILTKNNIEKYKNSGKIYFSNIEKIYQTLFGIFDFIIILFMKSNEHLRKNEHDIISEEINLNERV
jgi:phytoene synthase